MKDLFRNVSSLLWLHVQNDMTDLRKSLAICKVCFHKMVSIIKIHRFNFIIINLTIINYNNNWTDTVVVIFFYIFCDFNVLQCNATDKVNSLGWDHF